MPWDTARWNGCSVPTIVNGVSELSYIDVESSERCKIDVCLQYMRTVTLNSFFNLAAPSISNQDLE